MWSTHPVLGSISNESTVIVLSPFRLSERLMLANSFTVAVIKFEINLVINTEVFRHEN